LLVYIGMVLCCCCWCCFSGHDGIVVLRIAWSMVLLSLDMVIVAGVSAGVGLTIGCVVFFGVEGHGGWTCSICGMAD